MLETGREDRRVGNATLAVEGLPRRVMWSGLSVMLLLAALTLTVLAEGPGVLPGDVAIARAVQGVDFPGSGFVAGYGYWIGSFPVVTLISLISLTFLLWCRRVAAASLMLVVLLARSLNPWLKSLIDSPRPASSDVQVSEVASGLGFPSGHVMGTVLLAGVAVYLTLTLGARGQVQSSVLAVALFSVVATSYSRIESGAHWPSDVLGGVVWGLAILVILIPGHDRLVASVMSGRASNTAGSDADNPSSS